MSSNAADLQNYTRRFWAQRAPAPMFGGGEILEIVEMEGIAELSGFTLKSLRVFSGRDDFPSPVARVKRRLFWRKDDIQHWINIKRSRGHPAR